MTATGKPDLDMLAIRHELLNAVNGLTAAIAALDTGDVDTAQWTLDSIDTATDALSRAETALGREA